VTDWVPRCDVCGEDGSHRTLTVTSKCNGIVECYCDFCEGLVRDGLLRPEMVEGKLRFRQYHPVPMQPGELVPARD
jgi:hypothetical protein